MSGEAAAGFVVREGVCHAHYAFDIGFAVDLEEAARRATAAGWQVEHRAALTRPPPAADVPLRLTEPCEPMAFGPFFTRPEVRLLLYEYGGVSLRFTIPFHGSFQDMLAISCALRADERLADDARRRVDRLLRSVQPAVTRPGVADVVEDYVVFQVQDFESPVPVERLQDAYGAELARILRAERHALSAQEIGDALQCRISYEPDDLTLVDWYAALVVDRDPEDTLTVLETANLELLELRFLDRKLDLALEDAYALLTQRGMRIPRLFRGLRDLRRLAQLQMDGAVMFERISNGLKLLGDEYLARVYRLAGQRFHQADWNAAIGRKLDVLDGLHHKLTERASSLRLEILEWIIIVLILFEIVISLAPLFKTAGGPP